MKMLCKMFGHKYSVVVPLRYNYYKTKCGRCGFEGVGHTSTLSNRNGVVELTSDWRRMINS